MKHIIPNLWFDKEAKDAAHFYASVFTQSKVTNISTIHGTPSGDCDLVSFEVKGTPFMAISAGPYFKLNPSISFMVNFDPSQEKDAAKNIETAWKKLSDGGKVLMPIQEYPWSKRYGWVQDKFGVSWQLILTNPEGEERPQVIPSLLFTGKVHGRAEEAINFYLSVFKDSKSTGIMRYGKGQEPEKEGTVMFADFKLLGTWFVAMDSAQEHKFAFNEAVSFIVTCDTQEEIDYYWKNLSAVKEAEQCGWIKDRFGVSWQITPTIMDEMMKTKDPVKLERVTKALLAMKKFDIAALKKAYEGM